MEFRGNLQLSFQIPDIEQRKQAAYFTETMIYTPKSATREQIKSVANSFGYSLVLILSFTFRPDRQV